MKYPLAARVRPRVLADILGQEHLLGFGKLLANVAATRKLHSMILWGPPGCGKTTLARVLCNECGVAFKTFSAVSASVKDIREAGQAGAGQLTLTQSVVFMDEVHRFNKAQQDAFLPYVENGDFFLLGATTENPSFTLNNALLSRVRVYVLEPLGNETLLAILGRAMEQDAVLAKVVLAERSRRIIAEAADGDARKALNLLEQAVLTTTPDRDGVRTVSEKTIALLVAQNVRRFDRGGDIFFDQISALHKSIRGSDPDASLYWLARMLDGGCDPLYIARRLVRIANEDVGNADPQAWSVALNAWLCYERLGSPEGELGIAQAALYLACAPKSNAVHVAFKTVMSEVKAQKSLPVPLHLRNAPTELLRSLGHGKTYRYAHDEPDAFAAGERYFPDGVPETMYYKPTNRGWEAYFRERLEYLDSLTRKRGG